MIRIYPSKFNGTLRAPAAPAHAQRLLLMASLAATPTTVENVPDCGDIDTVIECLKELGCGVEKNGSSVKVVPLPRVLSAKTYSFNFGRSAATARMVSAIAAALGLKAECTADPELARLSEFSLTSRLALRGVKFSGFSLPYTQQGRLGAGEYVFGGTEGSHFISALLIALPILHSDSSIRLSEPLADSSFVELTIESLKSFGIRIEKTENGYFIPGRQQYISPGSIRTENDWGIASMWVVAAAAGGEGRGTVVISDLEGDSPQLYRGLGPYLPLIAQDFLGMDFDASECPGIASLVAAMSAVKGADVNIYGVPQLKNKETDRHSLMGSIARLLGQDAEPLPGGIHIIGSGRPEYAEDTVIDCQSDPWIFMSMALSAPKLSKPLILSDETTADKIYRDFLKDYGELGGRYEILK